MDGAKVPKKQDNPDLILYSLLFNNPIYQYVTDQEDIHIMILGNGEWAKNFIKIVLQTCQVTNRSVIITLASDEPEKVKQEYLKTRPAVSEFVNVNDSLKDSDKEIYGVLNFVKGSFNKNEEQNHVAVIEDLFAKNGKPQYVFIDLTGSDILNYHVAQTFAKVILSTCVKERENEQFAHSQKNLTEKNECNTISLFNRLSGLGAFDFQNANFKFINYVITGERKTEQYKGGTPLFVNESIPAAVLEPLDQMAFNAHLSWYNTLNVDQNEIHEEFRKDIYNYNSSLAFVLSIPYKLWSVGIDIANNSIENAAALFQEMLDEHNMKQPNEKYLSLIQLEHRRWVLDKICDKKGWRAPDKVNGLFDYTYCITRCSVKDIDKRIHPCIVHSTKAMPLKTEFYSKEPRENWNIANEKDATLDELDRMSIDLHRTFYKKAQEVIADKPLEKGYICTLEKVLFDEKKDKVVLRAFNRYRYCIKNILTGNKAYSKQFEGVQNDFKKALTELPPKKKQVIYGDEKNQNGGLLKRIEDMLFPVIESNLYRDYKSLDEALVKNIPFIMTYKQTQELILAFDDDRQGNGRNNAIFQNVASATVLNPLRIKYLYYYDKYTNEELLISKIRSVISYLKKRIVRCEITFVIAYQCLNDRIFTARINDVHFVIKKCYNEEEAIKIFESCLSSSPNTLYDGTTNLFISSFWNSVLIRKIRAIIPYFEFDDFRYKHFTNCNRCDFLTYLEKATVISKTHLRIEDMFSLMNAVNNKPDIPKFADKYDAIWRIYIGDLLIEKIKDKAKRWEYGVRNWNILCSFLDDYTKGLAPHKCTEVVFVFKNLNGNSGRRNQGEFVIENEMFYEQYKDILKKLQELELIEKLNVSSILDNKARATFAFTTKEAKELMCKAGEILEIFTYFEVLKTGYFDDIACSYTFQWERGGVTNELDCVLTKGFRTIIVECKAVYKLEQTYYQKLDSLTNQFGIAEKAVVLANTYDHGKDAVTINNKNIIRGEQMDIITISKPEDIINIGQNLCDIMEGKKGGKDYV